MAGGHSSVSGSVLPVSEGQKEGDCCHRVSGTQGSPSEQSQILAGLCPLSHLQQKWQKGSCGWGDVLRLDG